MYKEAKIKMTNFLSETKQEKKERKERKKGTKKKTINLAVGENSKIFQNDEQIKFFKNTS